MLLNKIEHTLHPWVTFFIMPIFAFVNAGCTKLEAFKSLLHLFNRYNNWSFSRKTSWDFFAFSYAAIKFKITFDYQKIQIMVQFFGLCVLTAIGASMSLFISSIAYEHSDIYNYADKLAILIYPL